MQNVHRDSLEITVDILMSLDFRKAYSSVFAANP